MTTKEKLLKNFERGIIGDYRDEQEFMREWNLLPDEPTAEQEGTFKRMIERWAAFYPENSKPEHMSDSEYHNSLRN